MPSGPTDASHEATVLHLINGESVGGIERVVMTLCRLHRRVLAQVVCLMDGEMRRTPGLAPDLVAMAGRMDVTAALRLARYVRRHGVDVVVAHTLRANLVAAMTARLAGVPVVATVHSPIARDSEKRSRNARNAWLQRRLVRWTDAYIAVSEKLRQEMVAMGVPPSRVAVVRNGVETELYAAGHGRAFRRSLPGIEAGAPLVGTLALLRPRKGVEDLLRAAPLVLRDHPSCRFVVAGRAEDPAYAATLHRLCLDLGIADRVVLTGFREDVPDLLAALDVFVLPSLFGEGLPLAVLEAMAAGRAVVATDTEGNREIIEDDATGALVPPRDPQSLARVVTALLADPARRCEMGAAARRAAAERFGAERMAREAEAAYLRALAGHSSR